MSRLKEKQCGSKQRFETMEAADKAAHRPWKTLNRGAFMVAYSCRYCSGFHYGHPKGKR